MGFFNKVYQIVQKIPYGKVATYGDIARLCGRPRAAREVGWALHQNPHFIDIPCHRVVNRFGRLAPAFAFGGADIQKSLLEQEGVEVGEDYAVDLAQYRYTKLDD